MREVEITLPKSYTKDLPIKYNKLGIREKPHYRMGDLSPLLGIHPATIRWRFKSGKYPEMPSDGKGRLFAVADIERILAITKNLSACRKPNRAGGP